MTKIPEAFEKLIESKQKEAAEQKRKLELQRIQEEAKFQRCFDIVYHGLFPYHNVYINGTKIEIEKDLNGAILLKLNGREFYRFILKKEYSTCSCENACNCKVESWYKVMVYNIKTDAYTDWSSTTDLSNYQNENYVAQGIYSILKINKVLL